MSKGITRGSGLLEKFLAKQRVNLANKHIPKKFREGKILDVGCGSWPFFLLQTKFNEKYGIDPNLEFSEELSSLHLYRLELKENIKLPFADNYFDVITMLAVFEHLEVNNLNFVLSEVYRTLKPCGRFILTTPHPWGDKLLRIMVKFRLVSAEEIEDHKGAYFNEQIFDYLQNVGFASKKITCGSFEFWLNNWVTTNK